MKIEKHIKIEIDKLFEEMKESVKENWINKTISHTSRWGYPVCYSKTIWDFRIKALNISKENLFWWTLEDRNKFTQWFWRKTTPYFWLKKDLFTNKRIYE